MNNSSCQRLCRGRIHLPIHPIALAVAALAMPLAHAQTTPAAAPAPAAAASAPTTGLQVVQVTANKRVERLEQVPLAISVLSSEQLERQNVRSLEDVITLSPALTVTYGTTPANNGINMRGIGTSSIGVGVESDVSVILDDVPMALQFQAFQDLSDVLRVEIVKGPQSTLYGKSSIAGALIVTTKPVSGPLRGEASTLISSDREKRIRASFGGDLGERFGLRIAASHNDYPGNLNNLSTGNKANGSKGSTVMGKLVWRPTDAIDVELAPRYNKTETTCCALALTSMVPIQGALLSNVAQLPATTLLAGITPGPYNRDIRNDTTTGLNSTLQGASLKVNAQLPSGHLITSITSSEHYKADDIRDQDFVDVPTLLYYPLANGRPAGINEGYVQYGTYDIKSLSQELRLTSPDSGALRYVAGLWYGKNDIDRSFTRGYRGIALSTPTRYDGNTYNQNTAAFGQASWEFTPGTTALAGLRVNRQVSGYTMALGLPPPGDFVPTSRFSSLDNAETATTGKLSLQRQFSLGLMGYVMAATGYKGQAYDITSGLNAATAAQQPVPSETAATYELGLKGNFLDNRLTVNLAAFSSKFKDYQQNSGSYLPGTTTYVTRLNSIGGVETRGLEVDVAALLMPRLLINASLAYTRARVSEWPNAPCYSVAGSPNGGFNAECRLNSPLYGGQNVQDLGGGLMPNAPKWKGTFSARYDIELPSAPFNAYITSTTKFRSRVLTNINQDPTLASPGYGIVDLGVGLQDRGGRYKLGLTVNNLFDRHYANTGYTGFGSWSARAPNPPVTVTTTTWNPARDAFRYVTLRLDMTY